MPDYDYDPRITPTPPGPFTQLVRLSEGGIEIAICRWHAADAQLGMAQMLDFTVHPPYRRQGFRAGN